ncbi:hypothetical protein ScPMuIL_014481 [Solemya velum]
MSDQQCEDGSESDRGVRVLVEDGRRQPAFRSLICIWTPNVAYLIKSARKMRLTWIYSAAVFLVLVLTVKSDDDKTDEKKAKKLQIGIKKRVDADKCKIKSRKGDTLNMHYTGTLEDGSKFDSSLDRGTPFVFTLGSGQVIKGWDQGLLGMCEGEKRKLVIPSDMGYGSRGAPPKIPADATLLFEVELLKIDRKEEL